MQQRLITGQSRHYIRVGRYSPSAVGFITLIQGDHEGKQLLFHLIYLFANQGFDSVSFFYNLIYLL